MSFRGPCLGRKENRNHPSPRLESWGRPLLSGSETALATSGAGGRALSRAPHFACGKHDLPVSDQQSLPLGSSQLEPPHTRSLAHAPRPGSFGAEDSEEEEMKHGGYGRNTVGLRLSESTGPWCLVQSAWKGSAAVYGVRDRATNPGPTGGARSWEGYTVVRKGARGWLPALSSTLLDILDTAHNAALQGCGRDGPQVRLPGAITSSAIWVILCR